MVETGLEIEIENEIEIEIESPEEVFGKKGWTCISLMPFDKGVVEEIGHCRVP